MAEKIAYRLKGHEKFPLREGWLSKGIYAAKDDPKIFLSNNATDILGVGTNMVKSIRYWMQAMCLLEKKGNTEVLSEFAELILEKDPYFEDPFSLWILHSNIAKNIGTATTWYMFFNKFNVDEFTKAELLNSLTVEITNYAQTTVNEGSIKDDMDVLLNQYASFEMTNDDPEDKNQSPLSSLGLLKRNGEHYIKIQPDLRLVNDSIIAYELSNMFKDADSISIDKIASGTNSLGSIYNLSRVSVNMYLDRIEALGYIKVDRTAGLDMVYNVSLPAPYEILRKHYK